jgi:hypothetical protein
MLGSVLKFLDIRLYSFDEIFQPFDPAFDVFRFRYFGDMLGKDRCPRDIFTSTARGRAYIGNIAVCMVTNLSKK